MRVTTPCAAALLAAVSLAASSLAGCAGMDERVASESSLIGPTWQLVSITLPDGEVLHLTPEQASRHTMIFATGGQVALRLDCNRGHGTWSARVMDRTLRISDIATTRALCLEPQFADAMAKALPGAATYGFTDNEKTLLIRTSTATFAFAAKEP